MLQGLEDMLVHLTDVADRAHSSALVQPIAQGLKLRSKKSTKARALRSLRTRSGKLPTNQVTEGSAPTEPRGQLRIAVHRLSFYRPASVANRWEIAQKGSQENAFVTLGYVGSRLVYEIAVYEFKKGREKPLIIAVRSRRGLFSALSGICQ